MNYLPVLQELFESDSIIFMVIGLVFALLAGIWMKDVRKSAIGCVAALILYAVCEVISNVHTNFMLELVLLFAGTVGIGAAAGFLISIVITRFRKSKG